MITISNCPITGLERKVEYNFHWYNSIEQIVIECTVKYFKDDEYINNTSIHDYIRLLVASDSHVNPNTGEILLEATADSITEYNYYKYVLGITPLILPNLIEQIILLRDSEGKFNI